LTDREGVGCILEVDLEYPTNFHHIHNDYAFAPESKKPEGSDIIPKLIPKLIPRTNSKFERYEKVCCTL